MPKIPLIAGIGIFLYAASLQAVIVTNYYYDDGLGRSQYSYYVPNNVYYSNPNYPYNYNNTYYNSYLPPPQQGNPANRDTTGYWDSSKIDQYYNDRRSDTRLK